MLKWNKSGGIEVAVALALIAMSVAGRLLWHPAHVAPVAAAALFAGFFLRSRLLALAVPLTAMLISDLAIGFYHPAVMASVYAALSFPILLRRVLRSDVTVLRLIGCSLASSMVLFVLSNAAVWQFGGLYDQSSAGLLACYTNALPFLRNTLAGDLVWTAVLFSAHGLIAYKLGDRMEVASGKLAYSYQRIR
jgi:hypothetical protein